MYTPKIGGFRIYHGLANQKNQMLNLLQSRLVDVGYHSVSQREKGFTAITGTRRFYAETSIEREGDNMVVSFMVGARGLYKYFPYSLLVLWMLFVLFLIPLGWIFPDLMFWPSPWAIILILSSLILMFVVPVLVIKLEWSKTKRFLERSIDDAASSLGWKPVETWKNKRSLESII